MGNKERVVNPSIVNKEAPSLSPSSALDPRDAQYWRKVSLSVALATERGEKLDIDLSYLRAKNVELDFDSGGDELILIQGRPRKLNTIDVSQYDLSLRDQGERFALIEMKITFQNTLLQLSDRAVSYDFRDNSPKKLFSEGDGMLDEFNIFEWEKVCQISEFDALTSNEGVAKRDKHLEATKVLVDTQAELVNTKS
ncbi:hypothetical protein ACFE04_023126 [Oxalis oulophora]